MEKATTRRGALVSLVKATAGVSALGIACSVSQCTAPAHSATIERAAWDRAMRVHNAAKQDHAAATARWDRIDDAFERICTKAADRIEWKKLSVAIFQSERPNILTRADLDELESRFLAAQGKTWWSNDPDTRKAEFRQATDQIRAYRKVRQEADRRLGYAVACERCEAACDAYSDAQDVLMGMPAPDGPALLWKLELLNEVSDDSTSGWSADYVAQTMADARRLLSKEA